MYVNNVQRISQKKKNIFFARFFLVVHFCLHFFFSNPQVKQTSLKRSSHLLTFLFRGSIDSEGWSVFYRHFFVWYTLIALESFGVQLCFFSVSFHLFAMFCTCLPIVQCNKNTTFNKRIQTQFFRKKKPQCSNRIFFILLLVMVLEMLLWMLLLLFLWR